MCYPYVLTTKTKHLNKGKHAFSPNRGFKIISNPLAQKTSKVRPLTLFVISRLFKVTKRLPNCTILLAVDVFVDPPRR